MLHSNCILNPVNKTIVLINPLQALRALDVGLEGQRMSNKLFSPAVLTDRAVTGAQQLHRTTSL
jgi:hypothetical protein